MIRFDSESTNFNTNYSKLTGVMDFILEEEGSTRGYIKHTQDNVYIQAVLGTWLTFDRVLVRAINIGRVFLS